MYFASAAWTFDSLRPSSCARVAAMSPGEPLGCCPACGRLFCMAACSFAVVTPSAVASAETSIWGRCPCAGWVAPVLLVAACEPQPASARAAIAPSAAIRFFFIAFSLVDGVGAVVGDEDAAMGEPDRV